MGPKAPTRAHTPPRIENGRIACALLPDAVVPCLLWSAQRPRQAGFECSQYARRPPPRAKLLRRACCAAPSQCWRRGPCSGGAAGARCGHGWRRGEMASSPCSRARGYGRGMGERAFNEHSALRGGGRGEAGRRSHATLHDRAKRGAAWRTYRRAPFSMSSVAISTDPRRAAECIAVRFVRAALERGRQEGGHR